jgi:hypothetical protein
MLLAAFALYLALIATVDEQLQKLKPPRRRRR